MKKETVTNDIYDLTTRELRKEIRSKTNIVNIRILEYREKIARGEIKESELVEQSIKQMREATASEKVLKRKVNGKNTSIHTGVYVIPEGKRGEIGLGLSYKTKIELQKQLSVLRRFLRNDVDTPEGERQWNKKLEKQYKTFVERYGDINTDEYIEMIDSMNIVKNTLKDYGYEDFGGGYARMYTRANKQGKRKFSKYVEIARKESIGRTTEDILDRVAVLLRENKEMR